MRRLAILSRLALAAVLGAAALTACTSGSSSDTFTYSSATNLGSVVPADNRKKAEDVTATLLDGGKTTIKQYAGHVLVLNFWATWCAPCATELPQFDALYRRVKSEGVDFVGVNTKDQAGKAKQFVKDNDISFPITFDEDGRTLLQLGNIPSAGLPVTVVIDKEQRVAAVYVARLSPKDLQPVLTKLGTET